MTVTVEHSLPKNIARERVAKLLSDAVAEYSHLISDHAFKWDDNTCELQLTIKNFDVKGNIEVKNKEVVVQTKVPLILQGFKSKIKHIISGELERVLR